MFPVSASLLVSVARIAARPRASRLVASAPASCGVVPKVPSLPCTTPSWSTLASPRNHDRHHQTFQNHVNIVAEPGAGFDSRGLALRTQKKLLGKMSSKKIVMSFVDETTARLLDNAHRLLRQYKTNKKEADKLLKYIIKSVVKIGILYKNDQFNREELNNIVQFKQKFHALAMTVVSFHQVDFTYDKAFMRQSVEECRQLLQSIIERHLTDKSKTRVDLVFQTFYDPELLDAVFTDQSFKSLMESIVVDLNALMDEGNL